MRVGILTYPNSPSLGASLQMYSLCKVLEEMGHEAEVINYDPPNLHNRLSAVPPTVKQKVVGGVKKTIINVLMPHAKPRFQKFEDQLVKMPPQPTSRTEDLRTLADRYDRIIVGSDQVWNEQITGHDFNFYLEFCEDSEKKASYAASFGNDDVQADEKQKIAELLAQFRSISVREVQGQKIVESLIGKTPALVLDPTLLIEAQRLREQIIPAKQKDYVLFYTIKPSPRLKVLAQKFADRHGLKLVFMHGRVKDRFDPRKHPVYGVGPREFLGLVDGAEYIFTNSFHGAAISVALGKKFYVEYSSDTNSRLTNLVELLGISQCVADEGVLEREPVVIDYESVDEKLTKLRQDSMTYLREAVGE